MCLTCRPSPAPPDTRGASGVVPSTAVKDERETGKINKCRKGIKTARVKGSIPCLTVRACTSECIMGSFVADTPAILRGIKRVVVL